MSIWKLLFLLVVLYYVLGCTVVTKRSKTLYVRIDLMKCYEVKDLYPEIKMESFVGGLTTCSMGYPDYLLRKDMIVAMVDKFQHYLDLDHEKKTVKDIQYNVPYCLLHLNSGKEFEVQQSCQQVLEQM